MRRMLALLAACLLPLAAAEAEAVLEDTETWWGETVHSRVADGYLYMTIDGDDPYQPVAVREGFVEAVRALEESGEAYWLEPSDMESSLLALLDDSLTGGAKAREIDVQRDQIFLLLEGPGDGLTLRIALWNGAGYDVLDNPTFPAGSWMDTIHCDDSMGIWIDTSEYDGWSVYLERSEEGVWRMEVRTDSVMWDYDWAWQSVVDWELLEEGRNDGYYYGGGMEKDFEDFDAAEYAALWEAGPALLDRSGWAVVNNLSPEDRLPLYAAPEASAEQLGAFYNRTPVQVVGSQGEWTEVVIGEKGLTGWMLTARLAFGEDMDEVACAFPVNLALKDERYGGAVRAVPKEGAPKQWEFYPLCDFMIGELGDEWYIVMEAQEGWVGYMPQSWFVRKPDWDSALTDDSLTGGGNVVDMDIQPRQVIMLLEGPGDGLTLRVVSWNGAGYDVLDNPTFPAGSALDGGRFDDGIVVWIPAAWEETTGVYLTRSNEGLWRLGLRTDLPVWDYAWRWHAIIDLDAERDGDCYYGEYPLEVDFEDFDFGAYPTTVAGALAIMDRSGWAVVNSPNPEDCLPLYAEPEAGAASLGAFYSRTPVQVMDILDEWTEVVIGEEGLTGWMQTRCLAFGEDMDGVTGAFPQDVELRNGRPLYGVRKTPDMSAPETRNFSFWDDRIIGVLGDAWYIVLDMEDGFIGYMPRNGST